MAEFRAAPAAPRRPIPVSRSAHPAALAAVLPAVLAAALAGWPAAATAQPAAAPAPASGAATQQLDEVVVSASGIEQKVTDAPASISVISREELSKRPYTTLLDAVRDIEGVDVGETTDKTGQGTISMRGMGGDYTLILIDGRRQNNNGDIYPNNFGGNQLNHVPPIEAIERIEVIRGPMSTLYGADALGGVINIITRKVPQQWTGSIAQSFTIQQQSELGNDRTTDFNLMGPLKPGLLGLQIRGSLYHKDPSTPEYDDVVYPNGQTRPRELGFGAGGKMVENDTHNLGFKLALTPTRNHEFTLDVDRSRQKYDNRPTSTGAFPLGTVDSLETIWRAGSRGQVEPRVGYLPVQRFTRDQWALTHRGKWAVGNSEISLYRVETANKGRTLPFSVDERRELQGYWDVWGGTSLRNLTPAQRAELQGRFLPRPLRTLETRETTLDARMDMPFGAHLVVLGLQLIHGEMEDGVFGMYGENPQPGKTQPHRMKAIYAEDNWQITDRFTLTGGLRYDHHNIFGSQTSPRLYGVYTASSAWTFKGGVSTGYKTPKTSQLFPGVIGFGGQGVLPLAGNPTLQPETSVNGELAAYFTSDAGHSFNATIFRNRFKDKIVSGDSVANCEAPGRDPAQRCVDVGTGWYELGYASFGQSYNVARADVNGLELAGRYRISPTWAIRANYTYTDSEQKGGVNDGRPLSESAKHMANAALTWQATSALGLFLNVEAVSDRYRGWDAVANRPLYYKSYQMLHLGGSYAINRNFSINARINNLLNRDFTTYDTSFTPCTTGASCVGGQQPVFNDDYNVKAKARNLWIGVSGRF